MVRLVLEMMESCGGRRCDGIPPPLLEGNQQRDHHSGIHEVAEREHDRRESGDCHKNGRHDRMNDRDGQGSCGDRGNDRADHG